MKSFQLAVMIVVLLGGLFSGLPVNAQDGASTRLSLTALIDEALSNNPELAAWRQRWEAAREEIPQARALDDPELTVTQWAIPSNFRLFGAEETWIGLGQRFPFPGKRSLRGEVAARSADVSEQDYQAKRRDVAASVKAVYVQLALIQRMIDLHQEHQALLERFLAIAEQKYAVGQVAQQDLLKAQVELAKLHNSLLEIEQERVATQAELNRLLNRPPGITLGQPDLAPVRPLELTVEELQQQALQSRPELAAAALLIQQQERAKSLARKNFLPDVMVELFYWNVHSGANQWQTNLKLNLPWIFQSKYDARLRQAAAEESQARAEYAALHGRTRAELEALFAKVKTAEQRIEIYQSGVLPQAEQSLEAARIGYQAGKVEFLSLIDSERMLLDLQLEYYDALARFWQSLAELERTAGIALGVWEG
jgi:outer membrane protein TolC